MDNISKLSGLGHYSMSNPPTIYDEEALTALELCARTAAKVNETVEHVNNVHEAMVKEHNAHETAVDQRQTAHENEVDKRLNDQDVEIEEARVYMETNIEETTRALLDEKVNAGLFDTLTQQAYQYFVNRQLNYQSMSEYNFKTDANIPGALQTGFQYGMINAVYFPKGTYYINATLNVPAGVTFFGDGPGQTKLIYTGSGPMFNFSVGTYVNRNVIENMEISCQSTDAEFLHVGKSDGWGGSCLVRDCRINGFNRIAKFKSTFSPIFENCIINSKGAIQFTTYDGTYTETNFNNCGVFRNVYFNGAYDGVEKSETLFYLENVRDLTFDKCQFENTMTVFSSVSKVTGVHVYSSWFENCGAIYNFSSEGAPPKTTDCKFINVLKYNGNSTDLDAIDGFNSIKLYNGSTNTVRDVANAAEFIFDRPYITNNTDNVSANFNPYKITSKGAEFLIPLNTFHGYTESTNGVSSCGVSSTITDKLRNYQVTAVIDMIVTFEYMDGTVRIEETTGITRNSKFHMCAFRNVYMDSGGSAGSASPSIATQSNGRPMLNAGGSCSKIDFVISWRAYT